ncbi:MAG: cytochrome c oxidase subunit 3 [Geminicoccaceae bacterium]|nr:MAG: cytochrome c oxidase subunit 3 [Geminicoccaceae bacterium]
MATDAAHDHHDEVKHDYHLVDPSPWPFVGSMSALVLTVGAVLWMHGAAGGAAIFFVGLAGIIVTMFGWWRDVLHESYAGQHKPVVNYGLRLGMALFITSEVFFFFAFFWAYFWGALVQPDTVATAWPPEGIVPVPPFGIPLLNTLILLASGTSLTWAHHAIREGDQATGFKALVLTVALGAVFLGFQVYEYIHVYHEGLTLQSGIYGSTFFMATGFHGVHVLIGALFLLVCTVRAAQMTLKPEKHVGFEAAAWYWHFVDVVWLFLFVTVYLWGATHSVVTSPAITF